MFQMSFVCPSPRQNIENWLCRFAPLWVAILCFAPLTNVAQQRDNRWQLADSNSIIWSPSQNLPHYDHIEMSGKYVSTVVRYGVNSDRSFAISLDIVWPMLRTIPNNTHASLTRTFSLDPIKQININKKAAKDEKVSEVRLNGKLQVSSTLNGVLQVQRIYFPSVDKPTFLAKFILKNTSATALSLEIPEINLLKTTLPSEGTEGSYKLSESSQNAGSYVLEPSQELVFYYQIHGQKAYEELKVIDAEAELQKRDEVLKLWANNLVLSTPDKVLDRSFAFAKIRAAESIFQTQGGPMHGPGGLSYYAAIWANDQAEYINPFFPYLGYDYGIASALNAYRHFARYMNPHFKPIPSSIIAEGLDIWDGAGDRGDAAMIAYGATRFALSSGKNEIAEELWPLITWCLEYNRLKLNKNGVVSSDSDELEGRFPAGEANLCTSSLYYDALISAGFLGKALGKNKFEISQYAKQAKVLRINIERYFGWRMNGFETYRYYEGNDKLRAWICIPLTVDIFERKQGTIQALFSSDLWTEDGLASQAGDKTFWDRSTLYALRGVLAAGEREKGLHYLLYYANRRLLGEHVPYPVEAFPEGNQRHLSAESGLYCRVFTEGLFGIRPLGLQSFSLTPQLPDGWDFMKLQNIHGFGHVFDVEITRDGAMINVKIYQNGQELFSKQIKNGESCKFKFDE